MAAVKLEHVNYTVSDLDRTIRMLEDLFGWKVRWRGAAINGGETAHVGTEDQYVAVFRPAAVAEPKAISYDIRGGLNHIAVVVEDIDAMEAKVKAAGFEPVNHADYEPGQRFYFHDADRIEYEVVSYT